MWNIRIHTNYVSAVTPEEGVSKPRNIFHKKSKSVNNISVLRLKQAGKMNAGNVSVFDQSDCPTKVHHCSRGKDLTPKGTNFFTKSY